MALGDSTFQKALVKYFDASAYVIYGWYLTNKIDEPGKLTITMEATKMWQDVSATLFSGGMFFRLESTG